ncbi:MAG: deoxyribose-phosphate aldolase [bacterium]|nr:deoxyribose-phosphate aldolase [bacterium]
MKLNRCIDHTLLRADASKTEINRLCEEAVFYDFYAVCVNPCWVMTAKTLLKGTDVKVAAVAGFPLGANRMEVKVREATIAIEDGADEIDMVMNIGEFKDKNYESVLNEIIGIREATKGKILKVIVETYLLTHDEKIKAVELVMRANADFIKTSTGFSGGGAAAEDIRLFKETSKGKLKIKASGGIKNLSAAEMMIREGASRIGCSSSVSIMKELNERASDN